MKYKKTTKIKTMVEVHKTLWDRKIVWCNTRNIYLKRNDISDLVYSFDGVKWDCFPMQPLAKHHYWNVIEGHSEDEEQLKAMKRKRDESQRSIEKMMRNIGLLNEEINKLERAKG